jgi:general secretion pathway protein E
MDFGIGQLLLKEKLIKQDDLEKFEKISKEKNERLDRILLKEGYINEATLLKFLSKILSIPFTPQLSFNGIDESTLKALPLKILRNYKLLPVEKNKDILTMATSDPLNLPSTGELANITGHRIKLVLAPEEEILNNLEKLYRPEAGSAEEVMKEMEEGVSALTKEEKTEDLLDLAHKAPVIRLVNLMIFQAIEKRASDIHIEPLPEKLRIRYRIDGVLYDTLTPPKSYHAAIVSRIKVMSGLNIAERRLPQDGRFNIKSGEKEIDIRVSVIPVAGGERVVLRLLDRASLFSLEDLGLDEEMYTTVDELIHLSNGIILVTGPTGSGKTTTLYAALSRINSPDKNIITVEDPIEYQLPGIAQIQVKPEINLTFANGLRSILRHDPDIIMVGEMRDLDTTEIAVRASLTGHLVFSTLHTNDTAGAITRLIDIGIEPYLLTSSVRAIIAQRLVRRICPHCKIEYNLDKETEMIELEKLGIKIEELPKKLYRGKGCSYCNEGYWGRVGIFEILLIQEEIEKMIMEKRSARTIKSEAKKKGMRTLRGDGIKKVYEGITTLSEVLRETQEIAD